MQRLPLEALVVNGKRVLVRADLNCPQDAAGALLDDTRIRATLPTLLNLLEGGATRLILISHLGRPDGKRDPKLTLEPVRQRLQELLGEPVGLVSSIVGPEAEQASQKGPERVLLLENIRFEPAEEHPDTDPSFVEKLARLGDCYVNDAFGTAHRRHASTVDLARKFPQQAAAGLLMERELHYLLPILQSPAHPFVVVLAGGKVSTKVGVIRRLMESADTLCLGGAMAQTFLASRGQSIGNATIETEALELCRALEQQAVEEGCAILLPIDLVYQVPGSPNPEIRAVGAVVPPSWTPKDIGPDTVELFAQACQEAALILWNGPVGVIEEPPFDRGTSALAKALSVCRGVTIAGGGHTVAAIEEAGLSSAFTHVSTGGGATLELLEHGSLPGIDVLEGVI
jgi:phosphoglycerate kinase